MALFWNSVLSDALLSTHAMFCIVMYVLAKYIQGMLKGKMGDNKFKGEKSFWPALSFILMR